FLELCLVFGCRSLHLLPSVTGEKLCGDSYDIHQSDLWDKPVQFRFNVTNFILRYLICFNLSFVHGNRNESICNILHVDIQLCQHYLLKMLFLPIVQFWLFAKNQVFRET
ncbi:hypothetical protein STEG23_006083, partial [Scotinomys teguina]